MGNRRMGLGRLEALLEAVDRDLDLTNSTLTSPSISGAAALSLASETIAGTSGGAALSVTTPISFCTTTNGNGGVTLADGTSIGQVKIIVLKTLDTTNLTITPANLKGGSTVVADAHGVMCVLVWDGANWHVSDNTGMVLTA